MADNKDFEFQLRAQQELKTTQQLQQGNISEASSTYVDPNDGTVYEWDPQRRGWFPKVSETSK
jgi:HIV Tat-specific factor 1